MLFHSMAFAIFLPAVFILYWICPIRFRCLFLIAAGYCFYMTADIKYTLLLLLITVGSYGTARLLEAAAGSSARKKIFLAGLIALLSPLFFFKYIPALLPLRSSPIQFMLPVGISFYTFQAVGYLADIYMEKYPAEKNFGHYCLFLSFFPQLLSGPIGRGGQLLPQIHSPRRFDASRASYGLKRMAVGYYKKLVVAGLVAPTVDAVYGSPDSYVGLIFLIATFLFAIQIYCDFSGYTDIAVGCALLFGIELADNFKSPYFSHSLKEFWSRWHISLSSWFRDYVYIPLGGSRTGPSHHALNLMLTFLVSGLWHGAGITFLLWGGLHGLFQILENGITKRQGKNAEAGHRSQPAFVQSMLSILSMLLTFLLVCIAWVFFRADSLSDAWRILSLSFCNIKNFGEYLKTAVICLDMSYGHMAYISLPILFLAVYDYASLKTDVIAFLSSRKVWIRYPVYVLFLLSILLFSEKGVSSEFYYFQF